MDRRVGPTQGLKLNDFESIRKGDETELHLADKAAKVARIRGEKELQQSATNINVEYRKRINDTKELLSKVQHHLTTVQQELSHCAATRKNLLSTLAELQRPMSLTLSWFKARNERPQSASGELVDRALSDADHEMRDVLGTLTNLLVELDAAVEDLRANEQRHLQEIKDKQATIVLDRACISGVLQVPMAPEGSRSPGSTLFQSHAMHTDAEWKNATSVSISKSVTAMERSKKIRKKVSQTLSGIETGGNLRRPACVVDALQVRIKSSTQQHSALKYNAKMVEGELQQLDKAFGTVSGTLQKVNQNLDEAQHRLNLRLVRPTAEATRTGVEEVLEVEIVKLKQTRKHLESQLEELDQKRRKLQAYLKNIRSEIDCKELSLKLDQQCSDMKLPPLPTASQRMPKPVDSGEVPSAHQHHMMMMQPNSSSRKPSKNLFASDARFSARGSAAHYTPVPPPVQPLSARQLGAESTGDVRLSDRLANAQSSRVHRPSRTY